jgi:hypothetical protein
MSILYFGTLGNSVPDPHGSAFILVGWIRTFFFGGLGIGDDF